MRVPYTKPPMRSTHQRPFELVEPPTLERAAELLSAAKRAEINQSHFNGGTYIDYTRPWFDDKGVAK